MKQEQEGQLFKDVEVSDDVTVVSETNESLSNDASEEREMKKPRYQVAIAFGLVLSVLLATMLVLIVSTNNCDISLPLSISTSSPTSTEAEPIETLSQEENFSIASGSHSFVLVKEDQPAFPGCDLPIIGGNLLNWQWLHYSKIPFVTDEKFNIFTGTVDLPFGNTKSIVAAFDAKSGKRAWCTEFAEASSGHALLSHSGRLFVAMFQGVTDNIDLEETYSSVLNNGWITSEDIHGSEDSSILVVFQLDPSFGNILHGTFVPSTSEDGALSDAVYVTDMHMLTHDELWINGATGSLPLQVDQTPFTSAECDKEEASAMFDYTVILKADLSDALDAFCFQEDIVTFISP